MKIRIPRLVRRILRVLSLLVLGGVITAVVVVVLVLNNRPDLEVWHTASLVEEFTVDAADETLADYRAREERLFAQVSRLVRDRLDAEDCIAGNRFFRGSRADPGRWERDWNRTWERSVAEPKAGVVLLHGMSDSPYSLRAEGERLHAAGARVVGLRLPGHGTAPAGLRRFTWQDMAAAVKLAVRHVAAKVGEKPVILVGYSNGAALAVLYALDAAADDTLPDVHKLVLLSPAIGVTPFAAAATWQDRLGRVLGLGKLAWSSVGPEYDPFKYQSFSVNAAVQAWELTTELKRRMDAADLASIPPVLAFQSAVDATVSTPAVISALFQRLPDRGHELVIYDVNRTRELKHLLVSDPGPELRALLERKALTFTVAAVTNASEKSHDVVLKRVRPGRDELETTPLGLAWPRGMFSLSHVAIPFGVDDALYGPGDGTVGPTIRIGALSLRGERDTITIPASDMLRQRWNPFHAWQLEQIVQFVGL